MGLEAQRTWRLFVTGEGAMGMRTNKDNKQKGVARYHSSLEAINLQRHQSLVALRGDV